MGTVDSNTVYECGLCHSIFDFEGALEKTQVPCPNCGNGPNWSQLLIQLVCDFCSTPLEKEDAWTFYCPTFRYPYIVVGMVNEWSHGDWSACEECKDLILANDQPALTARSMDMEEERKPESKAHRHVMYALGTAIHKGFFANRYDRPPEKGVGASE